MRGIISRLTAVTPAFANAAIKPASLNGSRKLKWTAPRFIAAISGTRGRISVDVSVTGEQRLDANPYRSVSEAYTLVSVLGEYRFGRLGLFVTAENLTDVRQTDWDPIVRPARDVDGRYTVDAWAPLAGRMISGGLRILF